MELQTLSHGSIIRIKGSQPQHMIKVGTEAGYWAGKGKQLTGERPWTTRGIDVLHNGPMADKLAQRDVERAAWDAAPLLHHGDVVTIEGKTYRVIVNGAQYADPVEFRPYVEVVG